MEHLIRSTGIEIDDNANIILATVSDVDAAASLRNLRKRNHDAKIVVGGFEAYCGEWMLAYADVVVAGKGERFIRALAQTGEIPDLPETYMRDTIEARPCIPFEEVDFRAYPLIRVRKKLFYAVVGFGCKRKCAFCMTSWAQPYQKASGARIGALIHAAREENLHLTLVDNEYHNIRNKTINAQSIRIADLLENPPPRARSAFNMLHLGIEGFSEKMRAKLGKPVSNDMVSAALEVLLRTGYSCELFFISGIPGDSELGSFDEIFAMGAKGWPRIYLKFTTLNAMPHTPLWTMNLEDIGELTQEQVDEWYVNFAQKRNRRLRTFPVRTPSREMWRILMRRCRWWQVGELGKAPKPHTSKADFLGGVSKTSLAPLIDLSGDGALANSHIITPYRDRLEKASARWGIPAPRLRFQDSLGKSA